MKKIVLQPNSIVPISWLPYGARFYRAGDRMKHKYTKVMHKTKKTVYYTYRDFAQRDDKPIAEAFKADTRVVFLRMEDEP